MVHSLLLLNEHLELRRARIGIDSVPHFRSSLRLAVCPELLPPPPPIEICRGFRLPVTYRVVCLLTLSLFRKFVASNFGPCLCVTSLPENRPARLHRVEDNDDKTTANSLSLSYVFCAAMTASEPRTSTSKQTQCLDREETAPEQRRQPPVLLLDFHCAPHERHR